MELNLKDQSSAREKQRSTVKSNCDVSTYNMKAVVWFYRFSLFLKKTFLFLISFFLEQSNEL